MTNIPKSLPLIALALVVTTVSACSSGGSIRSDYDREADFSMYRTYDFMEGAGPDREGYESLFTKYMITAITLEMDNRGYRRSDAPDLLVNFNAVLQEKTKVTQISTPPLSGGYYGYRRGIYNPWVGYGYATQTNVSQYTEGTLNIDIVDARKMQLVWEAVGVGRITEKKLENLEDTVKEAVPKFFANYPFRAGDPLPRPVK
ncbi:MAG: DUF4136 domain-containing protein [Gammaproteobacteria bacterium]|nr:DUF4136 domain-containing protein [Gammaproteobacteria bacterium]MDH4316599.1 DUF4136 domain-containing protein [Gammaproteobacteria bacterium]MDH5215847.1 DUF4136 domain-containing protein [Gammaproteobacteria bacterium]